MTEDEMKKRLKRFALGIIALVQKLPRTPEARVIGHQLVASGTSVGANYRSACRGRSKAEFIAKIGVALEEADESGYWLELILEARLFPIGEVQPWLQEANEITAILAQSQITARQNLGKPGSAR